MLVEMCEAEGVDLNLNLNSTEIGMLMAVVC